MSESRFAQKELKKFGWKEGSGLGKNENGRKEAIKVKIKKDSHGVGHSAGDEFTFHWWDHVFNKAANSIAVETTQEGVSVKKSKENGKVSTKKAWTYDSKAMLYGQFVKGATLDNNQEVTTHEDDTAVTDHTEEDKQLLQKLPDEKILEICGGMTAHKGARHGLKLNGKLERIQEQERLLLEKWKKKTASSDAIDQSVSSLHKVNTEEPVCKTKENLLSGKSKKKKKKKDKDSRAEKKDCDLSYERTNDGDNGQCDSIKVKVPKKRKRNTEQGESESGRSNIEDDLQNETERTKKKKKF